MEEKEEVSKTLQDLYEQDIEDRRSRDWDKATPEEIQGIIARDRQRRELAQKLLDEGEAKTASDYHYLALIFQHGDKIDDYKTAHECAKRAMEMGDDGVKWLFAATEDRWLLSEGRPQKYGTQFINPEGKGWQLAEPIDPTITDEERAKYNVPSLAEARQKFKKKYEVSES